MRFLIRLILWFSLLLPQQLLAQSADSLAKAVDSNSRAIDQSAKEIQRWKDSLEKEQFFRNLERHGQSLDDFLQEMREKEEKRKRQVYYRIGLGAVFLVVVIIGLVRRRKLRRSQDLRK